MLQSGFCHCLGPIIILTLGLLIKVHAKFIKLDDSLHSPLITANQNSQTTLICGRIKGGDGPIDATWMKDGFKIRSQINLTDQDVTLTIYKTELNDAGSYRCMLQNKYGAVLSSVTRLVVSHMSGFIYGENDPIDIHIKGPDNYLVLSPPKVDVAPESALEFIWYQDSEQVIFGSNRYITLDGQLVLTALQKHDTGKYAVVAYHKRLNKRIRSRDIFVKVESNVVYDSQQPRIILAPKDVNYVRPRASHSVDKLTLECVAVYKIDVRLVINWYHNDSLISSNGGSKYAVDESNRRLIILNPSRHTDGGVYTCEASVADLPALNDKKQSWVEISDPPRVHILSDSESDSLNVETNIRFELPCFSNGQPRPFVKWYFNGQDVRNSPNLVSRPCGKILCCQEGSEFFLTAQDALVIRHMKPRHSGAYQCEAENKFDVSSVSTVYVHAEALTQNDFVSDLSSNVAVISGDPVTLVCNSPDLYAINNSVLWTVNDTEIVVGEVSPKLNVDGSLSFVANENSAGSYKCLLEGVVAHKVSLNVARKMQIVRGPADQSVTIGSNVFFPCSVSSGDEHNFVRQWYFKNQLLSPAAMRNVEFLSDGGLVIKQVGPNNIGPYSCSLTSGSGVQQQTGNLRIIEKPGMPLFVTARLLNDTLPAKVEITWAEGFDGNSPIIKFSVELRNLGSQNLWSDWETVVENVAKEQRTIVIDNLKPSANYQFRVIAFNRFGAGLASQPSSNLIMPQQPPAAAPRSVAGSARSSSTIMLQWQPPPPDQWNGDILGYILRYRLANYPDIPWIIVNLTDSRARNYLLHDLITWREYEIQVAAFNERGMGVFSKTLYITTLEGVPVDHPYDVSVSVVNSSSINLSFVPPPQQMIPGVNLGYKVELWKTPNQTDEADKIIKILPYNLVKIVRVIDELEKFTSYNLTVLCYTAQGNGPRSQPIEFRTRQDVPDVVKNLILQEVLFDSAKLVWDKPTNPNGIMTNYTLVYWVANETDSKRTISVSPHVTSYRIHGLTASTKYTLQFFAFTEVGQGPSQMINFVSGVPPELPGPPTALTLANVEPRSVILQFTPGYDGKTVISKWIIEALIGVSTNWTEIFAIYAPETKSVKVSGLRPFTFYKFRMYAENVKGRSAASEITETFQTLQTVPDPLADDVEVRPISSSSLRITWTPLQLNAWNGLAKGYELQYRKNMTTVLNDTQFFKIISINDTISSELEIRDLSPFSTFLVQLSAVGELGKSLPSHLLSTRTYESRPSVAPPALEVKSVTSRTAKIEWSHIPDSQANGRILGYKIMVNPSDASFSSTLHGQASKEFTVAFNKTQTDIEDLHPFTTYAISVNAFTVAGHGPVTNIKMETKEDVPEHPAEVMFPFVSPAEIRITWKPPLRPNGIVLRYSVTYWPNQTDGNRRGQVKTTLNADLRMFVATGIARDTAYVFAIAAETRIGWGAETRALVLISTPKQLPGSPSRPIGSIDQLPGPFNITINFDHDSGPHNRFFIVEYRAADSQPWLRYPERPSGIAKAFLVAGLKPNKAYRFRVKCVNDFGESRPSLESDSIKTAPFMPNNPPSAIKATAVNSTSVKISFLAPDFYSWNSDQVGFRIMHSAYIVNSSAEDALNQSHDTQIHEIPLDGPERSIVEIIVDNMQQFQHYNFMVQTFNQAGSSRPSDAIFVYLGHSLPKTIVKDFRAIPISSTEIQLSWEPWTSDDERINGFKISYKPSDEIRDTKQDVVPGTDNNFTIAGLLKFKNYTIDVAVFNRAGRGPPASMHAQTFADKPGPVQSLTFRDIQLDSLNVSWRPPSESNGIILGYVVVYKTFKLAGEYVRKIQEKTTQLYLPVTNLEENITTIFTVEAQTIMGCGPAVHGKVTVGPQPGSPGAPERPVVLPSETSVKVTWFVPSDEGASHVTSFIIQYYAEMRSRLSHFDHTSIRRRRHLLTELSASPRWTTLTSVEYISGDLKSGAVIDYVVPYGQLEPNAIHRFRVIARNNHGVSFPSAESESVVVPDFTSDSPFYLQWWFLIILALISLVIIIIVVGVLYITGNEGKNASRRTSSVNSINLIDGGVVTYEMRTSQKSKRRKTPNRLVNGITSTNGSERKSSYMIPPTFNAPDSRHNIMADDNPSLFEQDNGSFDDDAVPSPRLASSKPVQKLASTDLVQKTAFQNGASKLPSFYETLNVQEATHLGISNIPGQDSNANRTSSDHSSAAVFANNAGTDDQHEPEISSIVQHYQTSTDAIYRETWKQAIRSAAHAQSFEDDSFSSESLNNDDATRPSQVDSKNTCRFATKPQQHYHYRYHRNNENHSIIPFENESIPNEDLLFSSRPHRPGFSSFV